MDYIQEALVSRDLVAWVILVLLLLIFFKILKSLGTGVILFLLMVGMGFILAEFFPEFIQPFVDYVGGGWLGN